MANITPVRDGSGDEETQRKGSKSSKPEEPAMDVDEQAEQDDEDGDEEEYEIEKILDSKRGAFPEGRMGYLVKWKGYDESENSWVDEKDAGNAQSLIDDYWKRAQKKSVVKKVDAKTSKSRKSVASEEVESVSAPAKKRGRPSLADAGANSKESISDTRTTKKSKKNGVTSKNADDDDEVVIGNMEKYMDVQSWESLVKVVDTVEQVSEGELKIYFTLHNGEKVCASSKLVAQRLPQKLIEFYEGNLRWKSTD